MTSRGAHPIDVEDALAKGDRAAKRLTNIRICRDPRSVVPMSGLRWLEPASVPRYVIVLSGDPDPFEHTRAPPCT
jgi:hypothetical protein